MINVVFSSLFQREPQDCRLALALARAGARWLSYTLTNEDDVDGRPFSKPKSKFIVPSYSQMIEK